MLTAPTLSGSTTGNVTVNIPKIAGGYAGASSSVARTPYLQRAGAVVAAGTGAYGVMGFTYE